MQPRVLNSDELNAIAKSSGYQGGPFSSVGLAPSPGSRNLNLQAGNSAGVLQQGQVQSQGVGQNASSGVDSFNTAIMGLLQKYQQMGTKKFATQGQDAQQLQTDRVSAQTSPDLVGASPGLQNSVRSASAGAVSPTIQSAQDSQQTFGEQLNSYGNAIESARSFVKDYQANQDKTRDDARSVINNAFTIGGADSLKGLDSTEIAQLEKTAGYPKGYIEGVAKTIKERELELKRQSSVQTAGLTTYQTTQTLNGIINQYNKSPLVLASDRTPVLKSAIDAVKKDPANGALQLNLAYAYIQALDTYQSAVREGELGLVNSIDSKIGQTQGWIQQITNGQIVRPEVAKQIADAASKVVDTISSAAASKAASYKSQAQVAGVGPQWDQYVQGFQPSYSAPSGGNSQSPQPAASKFDYLQKDFSIEGKNVYLPRSVWTTVQDKDGLLKDVEGDGYKLLIR